MSKELFIELFKKHIKREGSDKLLEWLEKSDFFTAPASTKYHNSFEGGLFQHSIGVFKRLENKEFTTEVSMETRVICGLLHDLCKVDFYKTEMRNVKVDGKWEQQPFYMVDEKYPLGHGEKSVFIIERFMKLTIPEAIAINWHMGGFDDRVKGGSYALSGAFEKYPLALQLHISDMEATYLDEIRED
jgi:hypothetical protein